MKTTTLLVVTAAALAASGCFTLTNTGYGNWEIASGNPTAQQSMIDYEAMRTPSWIITGRSPAQRIRYGQDMTAAQRALGRQPGWAVEERTAFIDQLSIHRAGEIVRVMGAWEDVTTSQAGRSIKSYQVMEMEFDCARRQVQIPKPTTTYIGELSTGRPVHTAHDMMPWQTVKDSSIAWTQMEKVCR